MSHTINFLEQTEPEEIQERVERRRGGKKILIVVLIVLALYIIGGVIFAGQVVARALDARDEIELAQEAVLDLRFEDAREHLGDAESDFRNAELGLSFSLF